MIYYIKVLRDYAKFSGRARRSEYWYFTLVNIIILVLLSRVLELSLISNIYYLAILIPGIAVAIRRMHDVNKSGWHILIPIYNIILCCTPGTYGQNSYGRDPKEFTR